MYNVINRRRKLTQEGRPQTAANSASSTGWGKQRAAVQGAGYDALIAQEIMARAGNDPLKFLAMTSSSPSMSAIDHLPGSTPAEKAKYYADYIESGYSMGLTAWDMIQAKHDEGLRGAMPASAPGQTWKGNGADAAKTSFANIGSGTMDQLKQSVASDPNYATQKMQQYQTTATGGKPAAVSGPNAAGDAGAQSTAGGSLGYGTQEDASASTTPIVDQEVPPATAAPAEAIQNNANVVQTLKNTAVAGATNQPTAPAGSGAMSYTPGPGYTAPTNPVQATNPAVTVSKPTNPGTLQGSAPGASAPTPPAWATGARGPSTMRSTAQQQGADLYDPRKKPITAAINQTPGAAGTS
jgi:hypothetical protein